MLCFIHDATAIPLVNREERANLPSIHQFLYHYEMIVIFVQRRMNKAPGRENVAISIRELNTVFQNVERLATYDRLKERMHRVMASVTALITYLNTYQPAPREATVCHRVPEGHRGAPRYSITQE